MNPSISVIIPCYNQANYLTDAVTSLQSQLYSDWECIIINDGSTDDTARIAESLCRSDKRIRHLQRPNGGLSSARNYGLENASGDFIQFLDADDALRPQKFSASMAIFEAERKVTLVLTDFTESLEDIRKTYSPWCSLSDRDISYESILLKWDISFSIPIHCAIFRTSLFESLRFNEILKAKEDWLFWLQLFKRGVNFRCIAEEYAVYRHHDAGLTKDPVVMFENTYEAYKYIAYTEDLGPLILPFFHKVNSYWKTQLTQHLENDRQALSRELASVIRGTRRLLKRFVQP